MLKISCAFKIIPEMSTETCYVRSAMYCTRHWRCKETKASEDSWSKRALASELESLMRGDSPGEQPPLSWGPRKASQKKNYLRFILSGRNGYIISKVQSFPGGSNGKESAWNARDLRFNPWVGKIPWRREWQPTPVFLPGEFRGQRSLAGHSPWGRKEPETNEATDTFTSVWNEVRHLVQKLRISRWRLKTIKLTVRAFWAQAPCDNTHQMPLKVARSASWGQEWECL